MQQSSNIITYPKRLLINKQTNIIYNTDKNKNIIHTYVHYTDSLSL
jgi:hypothetical protein